MAIVFETASPPSVRLPNKGSTIVGRFCYAESVPWLEFGTSVQRRWPDGTPRTQTRLTLLVTSAKDAYAGDSLVGKGQTVTVYLSGYREKSWREAKAKRGALLIGDAVRVVYVEDRKVEKTAPARKVWSVDISPCEDDASDCERIYHERLEAAGLSKLSQPSQRANPVVAGPAEDPNDLPVDDDIPF